MSKKARFTLRVTIDGQVMEPFESVRPYTHALIGTTPQRAEKTPVRCIISLSSSEKGAASRAGWWRSVGWQKVEVIAVENLTAEA